MEISNEELVEKAIEASENAYCPASNFRVGAALLTVEGDVYLGCNIENSSYSLTNCAERTAFFKAISEGKRLFKAIAIVGSSTISFEDFFSPCGACRQVMSEFCDGDFKIVLGRIDDDNNIEVKEYTLSELLPESFKF